MTTDERHLPAHEVIESRCAPCGHVESSHDEPRPSRERPDGSPESWHCRECCPPRDEWTEDDPCLHDFVPTSAPRPVPETAALTVPIRTTFCWGCHAEGVQPLFESPASHVRIVGDGSAVICGPCGDGYTLSPPAYLDEPPAPPAEPVEAHEHDWEVMPARVCWACPCGARADIISDEPPTEEDLEWARQIIAERHAEPVEEAQRYYVRFDGPPSHDSGRFIELETEGGHSVGPETSGAHWYLQDDGTWLLGPFGQAPNPPPVEETQRLCTKIQGTGETWICNRPEWSHIHSEACAGWNRPGTGHHAFVPPVEVEDEAALIVNAAAAYREAFDRHLATPSVATRLARDDAKEALLRVARGDQP